MPRSEALPNDLLLCALRRWDRGFESPLLHGESSELHFCCRTPYPRLPLLLSRIAQVTLFGCLDKYSLRVLNRRRRISTQSFPARMGISSVLKSSLMDDRLQLRATCRQS